MLMKKIISIAAACMAVAAMVGFTGCKPAKKQIGLQLYSVAQDMSNVGLTWRLRSRR